MEGIVAQNSARLGMKLYLMQTTKAFICLVCSLFGGCNKLFKKVLDRVG